MVDNLLELIFYHKILISIYVLIHLATYYLIVHVVGKGHLLRHKDPEILSKYEPFNRTDVHHCHFIKCLPLILVYWPRFFITFAFFLSHIAFVFICMLIFGGDCGRPTRDALISTHGYFIIRICMFLSGILWLKVERVEDSDYRKWLGPDWKPQWRGAGTLVANHVSWLDIFMAYS